MSTIVSTRPIRSLLASVCLTLGLAGAAVGSGGRSSDSGSSTGDTPAASPLRSATEVAPDDMTTCPKGRLWDAKHKKCVHARSDGLPDDAFADYAYALANTDRYGEALRVLAMMKDGNTAEALNYRGYATRTLGRTDESIALYLQSVSLDRHYAKVREYLGEAHVIKGRLDLAKDQLGTINLLCGIDCEPYRALSHAITDAGRL